MGEFMSFISSYKKLEKLCNDIYDDNHHGVSIYIDEMLNIPDGVNFVRGWDEDLKQLKHYRWVRNQIVHELDCSEEDMCEPEDEEWIYSFCDRIINQTDPLATYSKKRTQHTTNIKQNSTPVQQKRTYPVKCTQPKKTSNKSTGCIAFITIAVLIALIFALEYLYL